VLDQPAEQEEMELAWRFSSSSRVPWCGHRNLNPHMREENSVERVVIAKKGRNQFEVQHDTYLGVRMARIDVVDEAIIDADRSRVFKALIDEANGRTHWWMPYWEAKPRDEKGFSQKGSAIDITTHRSGTPKSSTRGTKFSARITEVIEGKLLKVDFFDGDFLGNGEWNFEPIDGKTKVRYRWNVVPHRWTYRVLAPFVKAKMGKMHSDIMQEGFKGLNRYLATSQS